MHAISLHQPWASLIAVGRKPFETRSWAPPSKLIGRRIAIHAAKKPVDADDREWARRCGAPDLPLGAVVCTAILAGAYQCGRHCQDQGGRNCAVIASVRHGSRHQNVAWLTAGIPVDEYGDYAASRWAWWLTGIERLDPPIPARGAQGFWNWQVPP